MNQLALGGALAAFGVPTNPEAADAQRDARSSDDATQEVVRAVQGVRDEIVRQYSFWEIGAVRDQIRTFLRLNGRFPDCLDVGIDVWQQVYDWHVRYQQPIAVGRTPEGRYTITLLATAIVMRTDAMPGYIGTAYDSR